MPASMHHRVSLLFAATTAAALSLAACEIERTPRPAVIDADSAARVDIRGTLDAYHEALLAGDVAKAASHYAADARVHRSDQADLNGSAAIRAALAGALAERPVTAFTVDRDGIDLTRGGTAWETGTWAEAFRADTAGEATLRRRYAIRWRRGPESTWLIDRIVLSDYPPDTAATR